jgi:hypothetical protein
LLWERKQGGERQVPQQRAQRHLVPGLLQIRHEQGRVLVRRGLGLQVLLKEGSMKIIGKAIAGAFLLVGALAFTGCCKTTEDTAASSYCKANKADDACTNCCKMKGSKSAQTTSGSCKCFK